MKFAPVLACVLACGLAVPAAAQKALDVEGTPQAVQELFDCREIADAAQRLACYDGKVAELQQAQEDKKIVIADKEQIQEARRGLFGFTLPKIKLFGGGDGDDGQPDIDEITTTIASSEKVGRGELAFTLEDGARWIQTDNRYFSRAVPAGEEVTIKTAALGTYFAKIGKRYTIRVKRVN